VSGSLCLTLGVIDYCVILVTWYDLSTFTDSQRYTLILVA
jgi:hypothetical protein